MRARSGHWGGSGVCGRVGDMGSADVGGYASLMRGLLCGGLV